MYKLEIHKLEIQGKSKGRMATKQQLTGAIISEMHRICSDPAFVKLCLSAAETHNQRINAIVNGSPDIQQAFVEVCFPFFALCLGGIFGTMPPSLSKGDLSLPSLWTGGSIPTVDEMHVLRDAYWAEVIDNNPIEITRVMLAHFKTQTGQMWVKSLEKLTL